MSHIVILSDYGFWREVCISACYDAISVQKTSAEFSAILSHLELPPAKADLYSSDLGESALMSRVAEAGVVFYDRSGSSRFGECSDSIFEAKTQLSFDSLQNLLRPCGRLLASYATKKDA